MNIKNASIENIKKKIQDEFEKIVEVLLDYIKKLILKFWRRNFLLNGKI